MIPLVITPIEPDFKVVEKCDECDRHTRTWHERNNIPLCPVCAMSMKVSDLKTDNGDRIRKRKRSKEEEPITSIVLNAASIKLNADQIKYYAEKQKADISYIIPESHQNRITTEGNYFVVRTSGGCLIKKFKFE